MSLKNKSVISLFLVAGFLCGCGGGGGGLGISGPADAYAGNVYYVATNGSDSALIADGSSSNPWNTIGYGISRLAPGDTLVVKNGIYSGRANFLRNIPNGTNGNYTTIKAETPFGVRINRGTEDLLYNDSPIAVTSNSFIEIEGFVISVDDQTPPSLAKVTGSNNIKVRKCIIRRSGTIDSYANIFLVSTSTYVLVEDCSIVGAMRYGFYVGGTSDTSQYIIFRRCVVRNDYSNSNQPKASFAVYGNNSGYGVQDVLFQNCIAIDGQDTGYNGGSEGCYGGFYNPKNVRNVTFQGCIALNVSGVQGGMVVKELSGTGITLTDTVIWDCRPRGLRAAGAYSGISLNRCTIGGNATAFHQTSSGAGRTLRNSLIYNNTSLTDDVMGWDTNRNNAFSPASQAIGSPSVTSNINLKYITRAETGSSLINSGDDGGNIGATIVKRYGVSGTLWGEAGYDVLTGDELWPWPYENSIKSVFAEANPSPSGVTPSTNDSKRGFCADGQSLTNYIWTYLGNPTPYSSPAGRSVAYPGGLQDPDLKK